MLCSSSRLSPVLFDSQRNESDGCCPVGARSIALLRTLRRTRRDLLLDVSSPRQNNRRHRKNDGVPQGDQQSVRAIHRDKGWDTKGIGFELSRNKHRRHRIEVRPQKIGRDIQPEVAVSDAESERQEDEAAESVSRKLAQRSAQAEREQTSQNGHSCG